MRLLTAETIITPLLYDHALTAACIAHDHETSCRDCADMAHVLMAVDLASRQQTRAVYAAVLADVLVFINDAQRSHVEQDTRSTCDLEQRVRKLWEATQ